MLSLFFAMMSIIADPTIAPSAPDLITSPACLGVDIPKPTAFGVVVSTRWMSDLVLSWRSSLAPVTPRRATR